MKTRKKSQRAGDGISTLEVSAIAGHSDPTVTMKIYGGLYPNSTERAMKILDTCNAIKLPALREKDGKFCAQVLCVRTYFLVSQQKLAYNIREQIIYTS